MYFGGARTSASAKCAGLRRLCYVRRLSATCSKSPCVNPRLGLCQIRLVVTGIQLCLLCWVGYKICSLRLTTLATLFLSRLRVVDKSGPSLAMSISTTILFITRPFLVGFARNQVNSTSTSTAHLGRHVRHHTRDSEHTKFSKQTYL